MKEIWKDIKNYEELYQISNFGRIKRLKNNRTMKEKILKPYINNGYYKLLLYKKGISKRYSVSRLVSMNFIPNPKNKPQVNHIDGNKLNNKVDNLEWCTISENQKHAFKLGLNSNKGEMNPSSRLKKDDIYFIRNNKDRYKRADFAKIFNVGERHIYKILSGEKWGHI
jgi:hypothetical protein